MPPGIHNNQVNYVVLFTLSSPSVLNEQLLQITSPLASGSLAQKETRFVPLDVSANTGPRIQTQYLLRAKWAP